MDIVAPTEIMNTAARATTVIATAMTGDNTRNRLSPCDVSNGINISTPFLACFFSREVGIFFGTGETFEGWRG